MTDKKVRVRFAPSPTGPLHIGGMRTALYNYLFARKHGGDFLLRIEDTDSNRFVPGAEEYIVNSLKWCGIKIDEGVSAGGMHAPYRQSERKKIYLGYAKKLVDNGFAYYAFDTPEELDKLRKEKESKKETFIYNFEIRNHLNTSLKFNADEVKKRIERGDQWVIRFTIPENEPVIMHDLIRGEVIVNSSTLDDKVLFKSTDMLPTYHLANIVDDHLMEISHVIRGEEWLPSLPLHVLLYRALGWENEMPLFAHLPLLLKPDGKGKLSKRDGDKLGFPVFPMLWVDPANGEVYKGYDEYGFLPESFINFLALLGWNPGTEQEIFSMDELAQTFSLEKVSKSGAKFDFEKAKWFNQQYLKAKSDDDMAKLFMPILEEKHLKVDFNYVIKVCGLVKERISFVHELWQQASFFFVAPESYEEEIVKKRWKDDVPQLMKELKAEISLIDKYNTENIKEKIHHFVESKHANMGAVMNSLRLCLVGGSFGPDLPVIAELLGKEEVCKRIENAVKNIKPQ
jgi:glutamyl-tRNA synthetase